MVKIIAGEKGKGKTKQLLDMANESIKTANGSVVYLDKSVKNMYELNNKVRLINVNEYPVSSPDGFVGFLAGIISQNHDIEYMFLDSFLKLACLEGEDIQDTLSLIKAMGEKHSITFVLSVSRDASKLPDALQADIIAAL